MVAAGLPTGNKGNLEFMANWALQAQQIKIPDVNLRLVVILHHGDFYAGE